MTYFISIFSVEEIIRRLMKKVKEYLDAVAKLDRTDQHLTSTLSTCNLVHTNDDFRRIVEEYHSVTTQVLINLTRIDFDCLKLKSIVFADRKKCSRNGNS